MVIKYWFYFRIYKIYHNALFLVPLQYKHKNLLNFQENSVCSVKKITQAIKIVDKRCLQHIESLRLGQHWQDSGGQKGVRGVQGCFYEDHHTPMKNSGRPGKS